MSRTNYILQIISASISLFASLSMMSMISCSPRKLSSPYRRLVFGMSAADIFQSLALVSGPFLIPSGTPKASFASGTTLSCEVNGFFMLLGSTSVPLYMFGLSMFYLCKLNFRMSDRIFAEKIEKRFHAFVIVGMLIMCVIGLSLNVYNPGPGGPFCYVEEFPFGCKMMPEIFGECTRGQNLLPFMYTMICVICGCFLGIIINMTMLCVKSIQIERMFRSRAGDPSNYADYSCLRNFLLCSPCRNYHQLEHEADADYVLRLYKRETIIQSSLYVGAFFLSYLLPLMQTIGSLYSHKFPSITLTLMSIFYPLGGLFNIFVYTRPKIVRFRHAFPECSRLRAFFLVMKAGGEVPDVTDRNALKLCNCCPTPENKEQDDESQTDGLNSMNAAQVRMLNAITD